MASLSTVLCCPCTAEFIIKAELVTFTISLTLDMDAREVQKSWFASEVNCTDVFRTSILDTCTNRQESISFWKVCLPSCHSHRPELIRSSKYAAVTKQRELQDRWLAWPFHCIFIQANNYDTFINDQNLKRHHEVEGISLGVWTVTVQE